MLVFESPMVLTYFTVMDVSTARLAQSAERKALNLVGVGSSPTVGDLLAKRRMRGDLATEECAFVFH